MRAELRSLCSPDVDDLGAWSPDADFGILVRLMVGPRGAQGEESFDVTLCTPGWLAARAGVDGVVDGRHHLVVVEYDSHVVEAFLRKRVSVCEGATWVEVAERVARLGAWEFEDYRE